MSCTVTFDPVTEGPQLEKALNLYQYQLKGVSFLPRAKGTAASVSPYPQMPYEPISEAEYHKAMSKIRPLDLQSVDMGAISVDATGAVNEVPDKFCDAAGCSVDAAGDVLSR